MTEKEVYQAFLNGADAMLNYLLYTADHYNYKLNFYGLTSYMEDLIRYKKDYQLNQKDAVFRNTSETLTFEEFVKQKIIKEE